MVNLPGIRLGAFRAYFFGFFICTSGFLFGYDTGIVGKHASAFVESLSKFPNLTRNHRRRRPHPKSLPG